MRNYSFHSPLREKMNAIFEKDKISCTEELYESFPSDLYTKINGSKSEAFPGGVGKIARRCVNYGMPMEDNEPECPDLMEIEKAQMF